MGCRAVDRSSTSTELVHELGFRDGPSIRACVASRTCREPGPSGGPHDSYVLATMHATSSWHGALYSMHFVVREQCLHVDVHLDFSNACMRMRYLEFSSWRTLRPLCWSLVGSLTAGSVKYELRQKNSKQQIVIDQLSGHEGFSGCEECSLTLHSPERVW